MKTIKVISILLIASDLSNAVTVKNDLQEEYPPLMVATYAHPQNVVDNMDSEKENDSIIEIVSSVAPYNIAAQNLQNDEISKDTKLEKIRMFFNKAFPYVVSYALGFATLYMINAFTPNHNCKH